MALIKCVAGAGSIAFDIFNYLNTNTNIDNPSKFIEGFAGLLDVSDPISDEFLADSITLFTGIGATIARDRFKNKLKTNYSGIAGDLNFLVDGLREKIDAKILENSKIKAPVKDPGAKETNRSDTPEATNEYAAESFTSTESLDFLLSKPLLEEGDLTNGQLAVRYFSDAPGLYSLFHEFVKNKFLDTIINTDSSNITFSENVSDSFAEMVSIIDEGIDPSLLSSKSVSDLTSANPEALENYFSAILSKHPENIVKLAIPGIQLDTTDFDGVESGIRNSYGDQEQFGGYDQAGSFLKAVLNNTPRLIKRSPKEGGGFITDVDNPRLNDYEIKSLANSLGKLPRDLQGFRDGLSRLAEGGESKESRNLMTSVFNRFFNETPYMVNGVEHVSISSMGSPKSDKFTSSLITFLSSIRSLEHIIVTNDNFSTTHVSNMDVKILVDESYDIALRSPNNSRLLNTKISDNIKTFIGEDGKVVIDVAGYEIKLDKVIDSAVPVVISPDSVSMLSTEKAQMFILQKLGLPTSITSSKFLNEYQANPDIRKMSVGNTSIPNLIANMAYGVALNHSPSVDVFKEAGIIIPKNNIDVEEGVEFNPFKVARGFMRGIYKSVENVEGIGVKGERINSNGSRVNTTGVTARMYETEGSISDIRKLGVENTVYKGNPLVEEGGNYSIGGYASKDGIKIGGKVISTTNLTESQTYDYLIDKAYLQQANSTGFMSVFTQIGTMADRKLVELINFKSKKLEFLPIELKTKLKGSSVGFTAVQKEFVDLLRSQHDNMAEGIVNAWIPELHKLAPGDSRIDNIKTVEELDVYLRKMNFPLSTVEATDLVSEYMYTKGAGGTAQIKKVFLHTKKILSNDRSALAYIDKLYASFKSDVKKSGYKLNKKSKGILIDRYSKSGQMSDASLMDNLLYSYFYQQNTLANATMPIVMGSVYQFKGDMNTKAVQESKEFVAYSERRRVAEAAKEDGDLLGLEQYLDNRAEEIAMDIAMSSLFVTQSKRNASLGSGFQHPRLATSEERGRYMDDYTYTAVVKDPEVLVEILGQLGGTEQEVYDAAMLAHPLYRLRLNASMGDEYSGFQSKGGAIKDISMEVDPITGVFRFQKKATSDGFSDLGSMISTKAAMILRKMNTSVSYAKEGVGTTLITSVDENGNKLTEGTFENLQELWEGISDAENTTEGWNKVLNVLALNPSHRSLYVEKLGFKSGEKSGSRGFNTSKVWEDDKVNMVFSKFSNKHHGTILNGDHATDLFGGGHGPDKTLMSQLITAAILQGETAANALNINDAIEGITIAGMDSINEEIWDIVDITLEASIKSEGRHASRLPKDIVQLFTKVGPTSAETAKFRDFVKNKDVTLYDYATKEYVRKSAERAAQTRDYYSLLTSLLSSSHSNFNLAQTSEVAHSAVLATVSDKSVKAKFNGMELVVSPSMDFIQMYEVEGGGSVTRDQYMKSPLVTEVPITEDNVSNLHDTDVVNIGSGKYIPLWKARKEGILFESTARIPEGGRPLNWIKYYDSNNKGLVTYKEFIDLKKNGDDLLKAEAEGKDAKDLREARVGLKESLQELLNDDSRGWLADEAEFYAPAFSLTPYGLSASDNIGDIMGHEKSGTLLYFKGGVQVDTPGDGAVEVHESEFNHMVDEFTKRLAKKGSFHSNHKLRRFKEITKLTDKVVDDLVRESTIGINTNSPDSVEYAFHKDQLSKLSNGVESSLGAINKNRKDALNKTINILAKAKARNFPQSLRLVVDRVPTQGKQSYTAGKVVGFINSKRNSIYGAAEMLTISGADQDYDKTHTLLYSIDDYGVLYDYKRYEENGRVSESKYRRIVSEKVDKLSMGLKASGLSRDEIKKEVSKLRKEESTYYEEALKNVVVDELMTIGRSAKNAIEASTPVSVGKLERLVDSGLTTKDEDGSSTIEGNKMLSPHSPSSIVILEQGNYAGKDGISISASAMKTYGAIFTAAMVNPNAAEIVVGSNSEYLSTNSWGEKLFGDYKFGEGFTFHTDKGIMSVKSFANTGKFQDGVNTESPEFQLEVQAWEEISEILSASVDNANELILGKLGLTGDTMGMALVGSMLGIDTSEVISILKSDEFQNAVSEDSLASIVNNKKLEFSAKYKQANKDKEELGVDPKSVPVTISKDITDLSGSSKGDLKITSPLMSVPLDVFDVGVLNVTNNDSAITDAEDGVLKGLLGSNYKSANKTDSIKALRSLQGSDNIILSTNITTDPINILALNYARENKIPVTMISASGAILDAEKDTRTNAIITPKTVILGKSITKTSRVAIEGIIEYTVRAIDNPTQFNKDEVVNHDALIKDYEGKVAGVDNVINEYLSNKFIKLGSLADAAEEVSSLTKLLGINVKMPNGDFDVYKFKSGFLNIVNENFNEPMTLEGFDRFVKSASSDSEDNGAYASRVISDYESVKKVVNPFYVIRENKHYMSYINAMVTGESIVSKATGVTSAVYEVVDREGAYNLDKDAYKRELKPFVFGLGIDAFLKEDYTEFTLGGYKFDLSTPEGRIEFVKEMPHIVTEAKNDDNVKGNIFLEHLNVGFVVDPATRLSTPIIKTLSLSNMDPVKLTEMQLGLYKLQDTGYTNAELHDAVFLYSLITSKGRQSQTSFFSLFDLRTKAMESYSNFTKDDDYLLSDNLESLSGIPTQLGVPSLIEEISTAPQIIRGNDEDAEEFRYEDEEGYSAGGMYSKSGSRFDSLVSIPNKVDGNLFRSKETGRIYYRATKDDEFKVISSIGSHMAILTDTSTDITPLQQGGFDFGYEVNVNDNLDKGRVLEYKNGSYSVKLPSSKDPINMTADMLAELNENMIFRGLNFGVMSSSERSEVSRVQNADEELRLSEKLNVDEIREVVKGDKKYTLLGKVVGGIKYGQVVNSIYDQSTGAKVDVVYRGKKKLTSAIKNGLGTVKNKSFNKSVTVRGSKITEAHVFEYVARNTPRVISDGESILPMSSSSDITTYSKNNMLSGNSTHFISSKDLKMSESGNVLVLKDHTGRMRSFKISIVGPANEYVNSTNISKSKLQSMLGYSSENSSVNDIFGKNKNKHTLYSATPYNTQFNSTNSHAEHGFLGNTIVPNLGSFEIVIPIGSTTVSSKAVEFGIGKIDISKASSTTTVEMEEASIEAGIMYDDIPAMSTTDIAGMNAVSSADMVVVVDSISAIKTASVERAGFNVQEKLVGLNEIAYVILDDIKGDRTVIETISDLLVDIDQNKLDRNTNSKLKSIGITNEGKHDVLMNLRSILERPTTVPAELLFKTTKNTVRPLQLSKKLNKPTYVYSPTDQQWYKYTQDGEFIKTRIPIMSGKTALINASSIKGTKGDAIDSLFKKTSSFVLLQEGSEDTRESDASNMFFSNTEVNEDINVVLSSGEEALENTESVTSLDALVEDVDVDNGDGIETALGVTIGDNSYTKNDFIELGEDVVIDKLSDGTISIDTGTGYWVAFPSKDVREGYANFTGSRTTKDFRFKLGDTYYIIDEAHKTTKDAFQRRDQLLEEKAKLSGMYADTREFYTDNLSALYRNIRYESVESYTKYKDYPDFRSFMLHLQAGGIDIDPKFDNDVKILNHNYKEYQRRFNVAKDYKGGLEESASRAVVSVRGVDSKFADIPNTQNDVLVFLTDTSAHHKNVKTSVLKDHGNVRSTIGIQKNSSGKVRGYALAVADPTSGGSYTVATPSQIGNGFTGVLNAAKKNSSKIFYVELPSKLDGEQFSGVKNIDIFRGIAKAINNNNIKVFPSNIRFTGGSKELVDQFISGVDPRNINYTTPYKATRDATDFSSFNIGTYSDANPRYLKIGDDSIESLFREGSNKTYEGYKSIWRRWAELNPIQLQKIAATIGNKPIYDKFYSESAVESRGKVLADLLTERFVDNTWINLPLNKFDTKLLPEQTILPISNEDIAGIQFNKGKAMMSIGGKPYIATLISGPDVVLNGDSISPATLDKLGLGDNAISTMNNKYPFIEGGSYRVVSLSEFDGEFKKSTPMPRGTFDKKLLASGVAVDENHVKLAAKATIVFGIDTNAKISSSIESSASGTGWIRNYKESVGEGLVIDITADDSVWIYGSMLEDGSSPESVHNAVRSAKILVDKAADAGAEILIGNNSGVEEELKTYLESRYPKYIRTESGYKVGTVGGTVDYITTTKDGPIINRFSNNNVLAREGDDLTGATGTILKGSKSSGGNEYKLNYLKKNTIPWTGLVSTSLVNDVISNMSLRESSSEFDSIRGDLIVSSQRMFNRFIQLKYVSEFDSIPEFDTVRELDKFLQDTINNNSGLSSVIDEETGNHFTDDGRFKLSDVAALAMARDFNNTISYAMETMPDVMEGITSSSNFRLLKESMLNTYKGLGRVFRDGKLSEETLGIINDAEGVTYRDMYNLLKTLGSDRTVGAGLVSTGHHINKLLVDRGIEVFNHGGDYVVLNNDLVVSSKRSTNEDYTKHEHDTKPTPEVDLANSNPVVYRYLSKQGLIETHDESIRIKGIDHEYGITSVDLRMIGDDLFSAVSSEYASGLEGSGVTYKDILSVPNITFTHVLYNKPMRFNSLDELLKRKSRGDLESTVVEVGNVYKKNGVKVIVLPRGSSKVAISMEGVIFTPDGDSWKESGNIEGSSVATPFSLAIGNSKEGSYSNILSADGSIIEGDFTVTKSNGISEASDSAGNTFEWSIKTKSWVTTAIQSTVATRSLDNNIVEGQSINAIHTVAGIQVLSDGIAISEDKITDNKGTYIKEENGVWSQVTDKLKGGLKNKVRYQKSEFSEEDTHGKTLASQRVSKPAMEKIISRLSSNTNVEMKLMGAEDIRIKYGDMAAEASGFVIEGVVIINSDKATLDTPLHEFAGHIYLAHLKTTDPETYNRIIEMALEHEIADTIRSKYPENTEEELGDEIFSTLMGLENQGKLLQESLTKWERIKDVANNSSGIWDYFTKLFNAAFGTDLNLDIKPTDSLMTIIDKVGTDIVFNKNSVLSKLTENQKDDIKYTLNPDIGEKELVDKLKSLGFIREVCI